MSTEGQNDSYRPIREAHAARRRYNGALRYLDVNLPQAYAEWIDVARTRDSQILSRAISLGITRRREDRADHLGAVVVHEGWTTRIVDDLPQLYAYVPSNSLRLARVDGHLAKLVGDELKIDPWLTPGLMACDGLAVIGGFISWGKPGAALGFLAKDGEHQGHVLHSISYTNPDYSVLRQLPQLAI